MDEYIVYVKADSNGVITAINSSAFISGEGWTEIDRGESDRFHHAQGNYRVVDLQTQTGCIITSLSEAFRCYALTRRKPQSVRG